ncbi:hypothetical protein BK147_24070 [Paenibacillus sp. FSL R7-0337]|nr:hypothetical protein BK147_24070 [Paenibacillus sp. FSL R7-0337]
MDPHIKRMFLDEHAAEGARRFGISPKDLTFIGGFQNFIYSYISVSPNIFFALLRGHFVPPRELQPKSNGFVT